MLLSGLSGALLLAASCLLTAAADHAVPSTVTAITTGRVITCDGHHVQHLRCEDGVITVESVDYRCGLAGDCSHHHDKLEVIKDSCDGKKTCDIDISIFGIPDPDMCKYLDTTFTCFPAIHSVTCEGSEANLECDEGQVIVVYWADYGRRNSNTCSDQRPADEVKNVHCSSPATKVADSCNGKRSCSIEASNSVFEDPCEGTYKYLEVAYDCQFRTVACEGSQVNLQCESGQVITVHWAYFGRRDPSTCAYQRPDSEIQHTQCIHHAPKVADSCNGLNSCTIEASTSVFGDPCDGTYKYLEVAYDCQYHSITCEYSYANLQCGEGQVIAVLWAVYGRRDPTTCSYKRHPSQLEKICSKPTNKVGDRCNGKNSCSIKVRNSVFGDPCEGTYKYLEVVYECQHAPKGEHHES